MVQRPDAPGPGRDREVDPAPHVGQQPDAAAENGEHEGSSLEEVPDAIREEEDPGEKKGRGRNAALGAVIVAVIAAGVLFGVLSGGDGSEAAAPAAAAESSPTADEPSAVVPVEPAGAPAQGADVAPTDQVVPVGTTARVGDFEVTFRATNPDAADEVAGGDRTYADQLGPGDVLATAEVTVRNTGDRALDPAVDLLAGFVGGDGREYDMLRGQFCMAEDSLYDVGNMPPGGEVTGTVCQGMPADAVAGGVWVLRPAADYGQVTHFALR